MDGNRALLREALGEIVAGEHLRDGDGIVDLPLSLEKIIVERRTHVIKADDLIAANPQIAALVLGAAASGAPGELVSHFAAEAGSLTVPLMIVMVFAIILARLGEITSLEEFFGNEEVAYFVLFAWLGAAGPGPVSLDHLILMAFRKDRPASDYGA